ncbi:recombination protein RecR [Candidatus Peregrinibacteria bacterium]|nr:recombination protein RecR [Candidatus Peregrinibacteria bacterium]
MGFIPKNIEKTIEEFSKLPGIGQKSAARLTFYLLRKKKQDVEQFGDTVRQLKEGLNYCPNCQNMTTEEMCGICQNPDRDPSVVCVVEEMLDLIALEKANDFKGHYHVLHGVISPVDGVGPDELKIAELTERVKKGGIKEVILALNPSLEGEATAAYIIRYLKPYDLKITRIARGIPVGGDLEYADSQTLKRAFEGRMEY